MKARPTISVPPLCSGTTAGGQHLGELLVDGVVVQGVDEGGDDRLIRPGSRSDQADPVTGSGSVSSRASIPEGSPCSQSQVWAMTQERPRRAKASIAVMELTSTRGATETPALANAALTMRRFCMSGVSRHRGSSRSSCQVIVWPRRGPEAAR